MKQHSIATLAGALATMLVATIAVGQTADTGNTNSVTKPFQLSLLSPVQTGEVSTSIAGARLNLLYGRNRNVHGLDLGLANHVDQDFYGAQFGLGSYAGGNLRGGQWNLMFSIARGEALGFQESIYNFAGSLYGVQTGAVNHVTGPAYGARLAAVNLSESYLEGVDLGIVNHARRVNGVQFGLVNVAGELRGIQIGIVNVAKNGFLPVFPLFNAAL